ncbi:protein of unknown function [Ectopseudomonas oleovorans]|nr:protein of unknown function [Pseudomonas oleovorans]
MFRSPFPWDFMRHPGACVHPKFLVGLAPNRGGASACSVLRSGAEGPGLPLSLEMRQRRHRLTQRYSLGVCAIVDLRP